MSEATVAVDARRRVPVIDTLADHRHALCWAVALLAFGFGDTITTAIGLSMGAAELNPVVGGIAVEHGVVGIAGVKAAALALFAGVYRAVPHPSNFGVPAGLAVVGVAVTAWNAALLTGVVA